MIGFKKWITLHEFNDMDQDAMNQVSVTGDKIMDTVGDVDELYRHILGAFYSFMSTIRKLHAPEIQDDIYTLFRSNIEYPGNLNWEGAGDLLYTRNDAEKLLLIIQLLDANIAAYEHAVNEIQPLVTSTTAHMVVDLINQYLQFLRHTRVVASNVNNHLA
jgi:hypothetical protein